MSGQNKDTEEENGNEDAVQVILHVPSLRI